VTTYKITFADKNRGPRTVNAESYNEEPDGYITFFTQAVGQVLTIRKAEISEIEAQPQQ
jgi:hypothetical protein